MVSILCALTLAVLIETKNDPRLELLKDRYYSFIQKLPEKYKKLKTPTVLTGVYSPADIGTNVSKGGEILVCLDGYEPNDTCLLYTSPSPRDRG